MESEIIANLLAAENDLWGGRQLIRQLQARARQVLDPVIPHGSSVALLDYPNNSNVGDSLIWLGEIAYLESRRLPIRYVCDLRNYNAKKLGSALGAQTVILMHGGGNFGTLWPEEQAFRLRVLKEFAGQPVIQLPQSIHFNSEAVLEETRKAIRQHGNFTLAVRDQQSYDFAVGQFDCKVILCPDMAFFIGQIDTSVEHRYDRFVLSRTDHEKAANWLDNLSHLNISASISQSDWLEESLLEKLLNFIQRRCSDLGLLVGPGNSILLKLWNLLAQARLRRGVALLEQGRVVISDRLHVHILSILLDKPHVLIDNNYGKLSSLHQAWTKQYSGVKFVTYLEDALSAADEFDFHMCRGNPEKWIRHESK